MNPTSYRRLATTAAVVAVGMFIGELGAAQRGSGRGPRGLEPEKREAVWTLQANSVAKDLALEGESAEKLLTAYKATREKISEEFASSRGDGGGDWRERLEKMNEINKKEKVSFGKAIGDFLNEDQADKALGILGSFSRFWDTMTHTLSEIVTEEEPLLKATLVVGSRLAESETEIASSDREGRRERFRKMREEIDEALAEILTEDQLAKWEEASTFRGGRRSRG